MESPTTQGNTLVEGESTRVAVHAQSMTAVKEDGQRTLPDVDDVPGTSPEPPPPFTNPNEPTRPANKPPSVELEGKWNGYLSCDEEPTTAETDASKATTL